MYYVVTRDKVAFWGKISECAQYVDSCPPGQEYFNIVPKSCLTYQQITYLRKLRQNVDELMS